MMNDSLTTHPFDQRYAEGSRFEVEVISMLERADWCRAVARNGIESTHGEFLDVLRGLGTPAAKLLRNAPDGILVTRDGELVLFDAKSSRKISRDSYTAYQAYEQLGFRCVLFIRDGKSVFWCDVRDLVLIDGHQTISAFPPGKRFNVDSDGWILPTRTDGSMSGMPYKHIDLGSMNRWTGGALIRPRAAEEAAA
jgi:hypothetical protein